ncbi:hypothetical protein AGDE_13078 [Angomonas deanei]|uniref:Uncharacterized protein n=1 Tax=Angomonas deanei TaxID=59799 RepID=A0A7G2CHP8_9TRYP|nr:hypothetical protein AGDE_13078 [Angomonas deanei]CAD2218587.1 hypothetical protein, conserved [Angomonas deanei]|eukprot:EPY22767.1 hypothetical protein AGDE_13078 [Angomonas deanei]
MKPVPAIDLKKESYSRLRHRNMPSRRATSMTPIESKMGMIRAAARMKLDDVHDLRVCARAAQNVFDGTYISDKPQTYGEALVPLLMTQIVELKKLLPEALTLIDELNGKKPVADDKERKPVPIGAVVQSLLNHLQNLMLERDAFKDQIENKNKLNKKILDASDERTQKLKEQVAQLKAQNNMLKDEKEELAVLQEELEKELEEEKDIQATAESDVKKAQAQLEKVQGEPRRWKPNSSKAINSARRWKINYSLSWRKHSNWRR